MNESQLQRDYAAQGSDKVFAKGSYIVPPNRVQHVEPLKYSLLKTSDSKQPAGYIYEMSTSDETDKQSRNPLMGHLNAPELKNKSNGASKPPKVKNKSNYHDFFQV